MGAKSILLALALGSAALPSSALADAWEHKGDALVTTIGIAVPSKPGTLTLREASEFSHKGKGLDNIAQFATADRAIEASVYIYRPAYPDAALTAMQTSRVIEWRFGPGLELTSASLVQGGGVADSVIRRIYDHRAQGRTTTAGFLKAGDWIVKLRVSGPYSRRDEVIGALDALISGLQFPAKLKVAPAAEVQLSDCPVTGTKKAKKVSVAKSLGLKSDPMMEALVSGVLMSAADEKDETVEKHSVARNGLQPVCIRNRMKMDNFDLPLLQETGATDQPKSVIVVFSDAGGVVEMPLRDGGYQLLLHEIGKTSNYGLYDRPPSPEQLADILMGKDKKARVHSVISFDLEGEQSTEIFVPTQ